MIGDSHLTMMLEANKDFFSSSLDISAVTWPRQFEDQFSFNGIELVATGIELAEFWEGCDLPDRIDMTQFDQVVFISHTVTMYNIFNILRDHVVSNWNGARNVINSLNSSPHTVTKRRLLTHAGFQECLIGIIRQNYAYRIATGLRAQSDVPITVLPPPFLAQNTLVHRPNLTGLKRILDNDDGPRLASCYNDAHQTAFATIPEVAVVTQPEHTMINGCLTKESYREGAKRFGTDEAHSSDDIMHAGPRLGHLLLERVMERST